MLERFKAWLYIITHKPPKEFVRCKVCLPTCEFVESCSKELRDYFEYEKEI